MVEYVEYENIEKRLKSGELETPNVETWELQFGMSCKVTLRYD